MKAAPMPEDPPVMMTARTAEKGFLGGISETMTGLDSEATRQFARRHAFSPTAIPCDLSNVTSPTVGTGNPRNLFSRTRFPAQPNKDRRNTAEMSNDIIISGHNLDLTDSIKYVVREKMQKLFEHEARIQRLRIEVEFNPNSSKQNEFNAKGMIEIKGNDLVAHAESDDLYKSIDLLEHKLDRMLRRRSRLRVLKRKHPQPIELPAFIPKVQTS